MICLQQSRFPEQLADRSWDNVGLLVDNSETTAKDQKPIVLVTNDLTYQVATDAITQGASVIVSYRTTLLLGPTSIGLEGHS